MIKYVNGRETNKWLPQGWRKSTIPILQEPARGPIDIIGSAFLIRKDERVYAVSAAHVIRDIAPTLVTATKEREFHHIDPTFFEKRGLRWIEHPAGLDLVAIPFPPEPLEDLDVHIVEEEVWVSPPRIKVGSHMAHLGFPDKKYAKYTDGTPAPFPVAMPGIMHDYKGLAFKMKTLAGYGASGGPVFLKREGLNPLLVGVVIRTKVLGKPTRQNGNIYLNETTALPINLLKALLNSDAMIEQWED